MQSYGVCVIEGNIGVGKSTLCEKLVKVTNGEGVYELDEKNNPFLEKYYKDPQRWAFAMQINLLSSRYRSHMMAQSKVMYDRKTWCFMDRSYFGDACFARVQQELGLWTTEEYEAYFKLHKDMQNHIYYPTAAIFLNCDVENCIRRINKRMSEKAGRVCESTIKPDYLLALDKEINDEFGNFDSLILDFADLEYISSAGLRVLISTQKKLKAEDIPFVIKNVNDVVNEIFRMSGFDKILKIE